MDYVLITRQIRHGNDVRVFGPMSNKEALADKARSIYKTMFVDSGAFDMPERMEDAYEWPADLLAGEEVQIADYESYQIVELTAIVS